MDSLPNKHLLSFYTLVMIELKINLNVGFIEKKERLIKLVVFKYIKMNKNITNITICDILQYLKVFITILSFDTIILINFFSL